MCSTLALPDRSATCRGSSRRARAARLPLLIVHGVVHSELTAAADCVLPGSTSFEKDASYTNDQGIVQGAATVIAAPGDAQDDCLILRNFAMLLGLTVSTARARPHRDRRPSSFTCRPTARCSR